jgi:ABC-type multidrug transport system fused ATPase/permease subunit
MKGWHRVLISGVVIALVALSWSGLLERSAEGRLDAVMQRALVTFAVARGLNGVISVAQGTEIALQPVGIGLTITAGEILDPLNDLVERFSWLAMVASASLGTQMLLTEIASEPLVNVLVSVTAGAFLILLWWPDRSRAAAWAVRALALVLLMRFLFTVVSLSVGWVDAWVLEARQEAALTELTQARDDLQALQDTPEPPVTTDSSLKERFDRFIDESRQMLDLEAQLDALQARSESAVDQLLRLIVLFVVQTLLVPIGAFWLAIGAFRAFVAWARGV